MTEDAASNDDAPPRSPVALRVLPSRGFSSEPAARAMTLRVQGRLRGASLDALGGSSRRHRPDWGDPVS